MPLPTIRLVSIGLIVLLHGDTQLDPEPESPQLSPRQETGFVPNLGQWSNPSCFVYRSGPLTLFLEEHGWLLDLAPRSSPRTREIQPPAIDVTKPDARAVALRMTFENALQTTRLEPESRLPGHHDYFVGAATRWRTGVPRYTSVLYAGLYPGIDVRMRESRSTPEYDLLLQPGSSLSAASIRVDGAERLVLANDGSLLIETELGTLRQPKPRTWFVAAAGRRIATECRFVLLGENRFGFVAPDRDRNSSLTVDPGLIWSTFVGGGAGDEEVAAVTVDDLGRVTVAGHTRSFDYPKTLGAYDTTFRGGYSDAVVTRLDPRRSGTAQLLYSTFLGGRGWDHATAVAVHPTGLVVVAGETRSADFPTTPTAYDRTNSADAFISLLIPTAVGRPGLVYSTFLGGRNIDYAQALDVDSKGVITIAGQTWSDDFPTTAGAYDRTHNGGHRDVFVARLDPMQKGVAQLVYSTLLGGREYEQPLAGVHTNHQGVITIAGITASPDFPTTPGAYDVTHNGGNRGRWDVFASRLDPRKSGSAQLVYSTLIGGNGDDLAYGLAVDSDGVLTVAGDATLSDFPTTSGALSRKRRGVSDGFVTRLDPRQAGARQLRYSTFLGGSSAEFLYGLATDADGVVTVVGATHSTDYPTTTRALQRTHAGGQDAFISRIDLRRSGASQLVYSTLLGAREYDVATTVGLDASGTATIAGTTTSRSFPTTVGAFDRTHSGSNRDLFVTRLEMAVPLRADIHAVSLRAGGAQRFTLDAGTAHANQPYWIFGSETGTRPGLRLFGIHIPLNPDVYTIVAMGAPNGREFRGFRGKLDHNGKATATLSLPVGLHFRPGSVLHHAFVVHDVKGRIRFASNAVPLRFVR